MATFTQNKIYNNTGADICIVTSNPIREITVSQGTLSGRLSGDCNVIDRADQSFFNPCDPSLISWATYQAVHADNTITLSVLPHAISNGDEKEYIFPEGAGAKTIVFKKSKDEMMEKVALKLLESHKKMNSNNEKE